MNAKHFECRSLEEDRHQLREILTIPERVVVHLDGCRKTRQINLWDYPDIRQLMETWQDTMASYFLLDLYELTYTATYRVGERDCLLTANTFVLVPQQLLTNPDDTAMLTYLSGSTKGLEAFFTDDYFKDRTKFLSQSYDGLGVFFHAYYLQLPIHVICKQGPELIENFAQPDAQDVIGQRWTADHAARLAAKQALVELGINLKNDKSFVGGISQGGFRTLLLNAFDADITHALCVAGLYSFQSWISPDGESLNARYGRNDLLARGVDTSDILAVGHGKTQAMFAMNDGNIRANHFQVLRRINERRQKIYNLPPIRLEAFHPEPGRRGHGWPRVEATTFFGNAMFE